MMVSKNHLPGPTPVSGSDGGLRAPQGRKPHGLSIALVSLACLGGCSAPVAGLEGPSLGRDFDPAFFGDTPFQLAILLAILGIAALGYRFRMARLRARERELVELVERHTALARAAQLAAEQANRAKDQFLAVLSHELRTPLTPVLLSVGTLLDDEMSPEARAHLEMIRRNVELEARLVDDLLDVSRIARGQLSLELETVDVHEVVASALEVCFADVFTAEVKVVERLAAERHFARADYARLMQVFWNLIRNAAKFAPPDTTLTVRSHNKPDCPAGSEPASSGSGVVGATDPDGQLLVIEFQDTGIGIDPEMLERIFEPFERGPEELHRRADGLGLGLAIGRAIAVAHGGRLTASSPGKGRGATFRLELPVAAGEPAPSRPVPGADRRTPRHRPLGLRVLVVEDNIDTLRYLDLTLSRRGYEVTGATTLVDARRAVSTGEIDLLITDIELPDGSGLELMRELRPLGVPGIALSGYGSEDDLRESQSAGFSEHLVKPVLEDALDEAVCRAATPASEQHGTVAPAASPIVRRFAGPRALLRPHRTPQGAPLVEPLSAEG
jgi:signal transduction histidine kinase/ActR/RegA family two-component response regulator